ncbi:14288_t:CDS:2 [Funneliformis geosporum]|uniref:17370_t:CDS:1 n=1 Tax=Funneliformis geosporum TaxID=1117311 RepID=A0A9W4SD31_9GLOM|nr:17370_t:CDS:2 [Funneliformis geosporum]CAI2190989.1 14288_t:CDS:2 [Funneliformis geosporum]
MKHSNKRVPATSSMRNKTYLSQFTETCSYETLFLHYRGTVLPNVLVPVTLFSAYSMWYVIFAGNGLAPILSSSLIPILTMVIAGMIGLRTNTSYDRFWEGRKLWGGLVGNIRNATRLLWFTVTKNDDEVIGEEHDPENEEVKQAIRLFIAFAVAVKHRLRDEHGVGFLDLRDLIPYVYRKFEEKHELALEKEVLQHSSSSEAVISENVISEKKPILNRKISGILREHSDIHNLPVDITHMLYNYISMFRKQGRLDLSTFNTIISLVHSMTEILTGFERILSTPIPLAYSIHLKQMIILYCMALPPQLYENLGWYTVPITAIATFTFFGVDAIGTEIENPFGFDINDLPIDDYCSNLRKEIEGLFEERPLDPVQWNKKTE